MLVSQSEKGTSATLNLEEFQIEVWEPLSMLDKQMFCLVSLSFPIWKGTSEIFIQIYNFAKYTEGFAFEMESGWKSENVG